MRGRRSLEWFDSTRDYFREGDVRTDEDEFTLVEVAAWLVAWVVIAAVGGLLSWVALLLLDWWAQ